MRSSDSGRNIRLTSYDDIFSTEESRASAGQEKIVEIPLINLHPFKNHPFKVVEDERMQEMAESVREHGIFVPALARPLDDGTYELIAGHRRKRACELAGIASMPVIIRNLNDDEAIIAMVESNLRQRENIVPSERAKAMQMMMDALRHQGQRHDLTSSQVGTKLRADQIVAEQAGSSRNQVQRYIRLNNLIQPLLDMVDEKRIALNPAVELSYLKPEEQMNLVDGIGKQQATPSLSQAQRMKKISQEGQLTLESISSILSEIKKPEKASKANPDTEIQVVQPSIQNATKGETAPLIDGFIKLPIEPFLKFLPQSLFQNPTPDNQEKLTKLFLKMAELYKKWITKKREQQR